MFSSGITRRDLCTGAVGMLLGAAAGAAEGRRPPNIVLIISDDHAWTDYSFMGHPHIQTPSIDRLARQSIAFRRGYVPSSLCCPSLASILTGLWPHQHRITSNDPPMQGAGAGAARYKSQVFLSGREKMIRFMDAVPTLPRLLARQGYVSFQAGKWWQGNFRHGGFTDGMTRGEENTGGRHGDEGLKIGRQTMTPVFDFIDGAVRQDKPFFLWYAPMMPHDPHTPPAHLFEKYKAKAPTEHVARYWAMVEWFDQTVGQLMDHLDRQALADNTIICYLADNGWIQSPDNPRFAPKSKQSQYDGGLRTPILLRWPGVAPPRMIDTPVLSIDLAPTLLKAAGAQVPAGLPGVNLLDENAVLARDIIFGACFTHDAVDLDRPEKNLRWRWCLQGQWKLIVPDGVNEKGQVELYDVTADPFEQNNLASTETERVKRMMVRLDAWWSAS
jgi:uncharacterized sulfatase